MSYTQDKIPVTVEVLTFNNSKTIEKCIQSVSDFDEVLVLDGGSTDGTLEILKKYGATIIPQKNDQKSPASIQDFSSVRNRGLAIAKHKWFFFLDSDEYLTEDVVKEIREIVLNPYPKFFLWYIPRKQLIGGIIRDCSSAAPWLQLRFFHREHVTLFQKPVHEHVRPQSQEKIGVLKNYLVALQLDLEAYRAKLERYLYIEKERAEGNSKRVILRHIFHTAKSTLIYIFRAHKYLFCKGRRIPLSYEFARHEYNIKLIIMLIKKLIR